MGEGRDSGLDRRSVLRTTGLAGVAGLAGCLGSIQGGGPPDSVTFGVLNPMSGAYTSLGPEQRRGARLGVEWVNGAEEFDFTIEATYHDTETETAGGRRAATQAVEQDGATFLMGAISSSVALSLNEFALDEEVVYAPGAAAIPITGESCNEYVFRFETNTAQIAAGCATWTVENLGSSVWFHIADYAYGDSVLREWRSRMEEVSGFSEVGVSRSELGSGNYNSFISEMKNSDADVAVVGMTGGDLATFMKQGQQQGLLDEMEVMTTTGSFQTVRGALGADAAGYHSGVRYVPKLDTGDNQAFVSRFQEAHDTEPDNFARVGFDSIRMLARGIQAAESADPTEVAATLAGLEMPTIFGPNRFRECDHQSTNPVWVGRNVDSGGEMAGVELLEEVAGEDAIPPCEETGCSM
jgi:branched-chain amino acid transport system substrate-binding protein